MVIVKTQAMGSEYSVGRTKQIKPQSGNTFIQHYIQADEPFRMLPDFLFFSSVH